MGQWGLFKANLRSIRTQRKLQVAFDAEDYDTAEQIVVKSIDEILKAGLTPNEQRNLNKLKQLHPREIQDITQSAFQRGYFRDGDGKPNLSNAMDQVLIEVAERIKQAREEGEVSRFG